MRRGGPRVFHWMRRLVQLSFLGLFIASAWAASYPPSGSFPENFFLRVDPLAAMTGALRSNTWLYLLPAWIILGLTALSGRFFCAWICPLGSVLGWLPSLGRRKRAGIESLRPRDLSGNAIAGDKVRLRFKYLFLAALLLLLAVGINLLWIFDPLVIANRAVLFVFTGAFPLLLIALAALAVIVGPRFWCQEMCPLGAGLSLAGMAGSRLPASLSPLSLVKDPEACTHCGACARACPFGIVEVADSEKVGRLALADCALCGECVSSCPRAGALYLQVMGGRILGSGRGRQAPGSLEEAVACEK